MSIWFGIYESNKGGFVHAWPGPVTEATEQPKTRLKIDDGIWTSLRWVSSREAAKRLVHGLRDDS